MTACAAPLRPAVGFAPIAAADHHPSHGDEFGQHFVDEDVNIGDACDFYSAGRNTIATGVIEAVTWPVGVNSPVPALTSN
jgi:hypothetical protein